MDRICKMMRRDSKGFTLVELMVVLLIIGILVAIAIPIYSKTQKNAKDKACDANIRTIEGAVSQYMAETGEEVPDGNVDKNHVLIGDYLKDVPKCPSRTGELGDAEYDYTVNEKGTVSCINTTHNPASGGEG